MTRKIALKLLPAARIPDRLGRCDRPVIARRGSEGIDMMYSVLYWSVVTLVAT
jgi:hypothetical protein